MRFRLAVDDHEIQGFTLISPLKGQNPIKLEGIDDGECQELIVDNVIEYVPSEQTLAFAKLVMAKLAHGGTATIIGQDLYMVTEAFIRGEIDIISFNKLIYGQKNHAWNFKLSGITLGDVNDICKSLGLNVLERRLDGYNFIIKVQRP
jgi:hypothetical protein